MEPARNGGAVSATVALVVTIALAVVTLAMVGVGGGFAKPTLTTSAAPVVAASQSPSQG